MALVFFYTIIIYLFIYCRNLQKQCNIFSIVLFWFIYNTVSYDPILWQAKVLRPEACDLGAEGWRGGGPWRCGGEPVSVELQSSLTEVVHRNCSTPLASETSVGAWLLLRFVNFRELSVLFFTTVQYFFFVSEHLIIIYRFFD